MIANIVNWCRSKLDMETKSVGPGGRRSSLGGPNSELPLGFTLQTNGNKWRWAHNGYTGFIQYDTRQLAIRAAWEMYEAMENDARNAWRDAQ